MNISSKKKMNYYLKIHYLLFYLEHYPSAAGLRVTFLWFLHHPRQLIWGHLLLIPTLLPSSWFVFSDSYITFKQLISSRHLLIPTLLLSNWSESHCFLISQVGRMFPQAVYFPIRTMYFTQKIEQRERYKSAERAAGRQVTVLAVHSNLPPPQIWFLYSVCFCRTKFLTPQILTILLRVRTKMSSSTLRRDTAKSILILIEIVFRKRSWQFGANKSHTCYVEVLQNYATAERNSSHHFIMLGRNRRSGKNFFKIFPQFFQSFLHFLQIFRSSCKFFS